MALGVASAFTATAIYPLYLSDRRSAAPAAEQAGKQPQPQQRERRDYVPVGRGGEPPGQRPAPGLQRKGMWGTVDARMKDGGAKDSAG